MSVVFEGGVDGTSDEYHLGRRLQPRVLRYSGQCMHVVTGRAKRHTDEVKDGIAQEIGHGVDGGGGRSTAWWIVIAYVYGEGKVARHGGQHSGTAG